MAIEDTILTAVLGFAGVPDKVVRDIEKDMPNFARLCRTAKLLVPVGTEALPIIKALLPKAQAIGDAPVKEALPMLSDLAPLVDQLKPLYQQAAVIVTPEIADMNVVAPAISELLDFISKKYPTAAVPGVE